MKNTFICLVFASMLYVCKPPVTSESGPVATEKEGEYIEYYNPPADGFNKEGSDLLATLQADKAMNAMGGREAWDDTRYLSWNFFGKRSHVWDKKEGNIRIEEPDKDLTILMNIHSKEGRVRLKGEELTDPDSLSGYLQLGYECWVNDSYWLVMPFKLKDSGVTLKYMGEDTTQEGKNAYLIRMTFENVGVTPENRYNVWIDFDTGLVTQWAWYKDRNQDEAQFIMPWSDYRQYGDILLSGDRGQRQLTDIKVPGSVPEGTFRSFEPIVLEGT